MKLLWKLGDPSFQPPLLPPFFSSKSPSIAFKNSDETPQVQSRRIGDEARCAGRQGRGVLMMARACRGIIAGSGGVECRRRGRVQAGVQQGKQWRSRAQQQGHRHSRVQAIWCRARGSCAERRNWCRARLVQEERLGAGARGRGRVQAGVQQGNRGGIWAQRRRDLVQGKAGAVQKGEEADSVQRRAGAVGA
ncbi:hypothetical protein SLEP1_g41490 [Rubroshorea leprosula]|uniref:Uncharacterized protein n=1 Tax=Rubroshorea leprosula TaxID=152421 RepID=A0AAV5L753_9ROSI|nr:hypothetical protein SLEP1_g41490 [Rubroshorea leprosula]